MVPGIDKVFLETVYWPIPFETRMHHSRMGTDRGNGRHLERVSN